MASTVANVRLRKIPPSLTVKVTVIETPEYKFRYWLGTQLIRLAVLIWGCHVEFVNKEFNE